MFLRLLILLCFAVRLHPGSVELGIDLFFESPIARSFQGKNIGLITNQTGINKQGIPTPDLFFENNRGLHLAAIFVPEHGLSGNITAAQEVPDTKIRGIPVYSLYGKTRRPSPSMLRGIDLLVYDIQDIGIRSYTYATTLFYVMEEAAAAGIPVVVLDRPNPMGGVAPDGPMLDEKFRSFIGYLNIPYCHAMTIGELALYFNGEYGIGCRLEVIRMQGWKRSMSFSETGLCWIPTSPNIPEPDTPLYCASTGLIGELGIVSIGIGHTLPFKIVGAPWIDKRLLAEKLSSLQLPGVQFFPFEFTPAFGLYKGEDCQGVLLFVSDRTTYRPVKVQHCILGMLKSLYPAIMEEKLHNVPKQKKDLFNQAEGTDQIFSILCKERYPLWKMIGWDAEKTASFRTKGKKYLLYN